LAAKILGINCTADNIFTALTSGESAQFEVVSTDRLAFSIETDEGIRDLHRTLHTVLSAAKNHGITEIVVLKCSSGPRGSSIEAIKAEGIVELVATSELMLKLKRVAPQGLPSTLKCTPGQKWQARAKQLFNPNGEIKYWNGIDGAVAAAYKAAKP
jgi:hypothetical protein